MAKKVYKVRVLNPTFDPRQMTRSRASARRGRGRSRNPKDRHVMAGETDEGDDPWIVIADEVEPGVFEVHYWEFDPRSDAWTEQTWDRVHAKTGHRAHLSAVGGKQGDADDRRDIDSLPRWVWREVAATVPEDSDLTWIVREDDNPRERRLAARLARGESR